MQSEIDFEQWTGWEALLIGCIFASESLQRENMMDALKKSSREREKKWEWNDPCTGELQVDTHLISFQSLPSLVLYIKSHNTPRNLTAIQKTFAKVNYEEE